MYWNHPLHQNHRDHQHPPPVVHRHPPPRNADLDPPPSLPHIRRPSLSSSSPTNHLNQPAIGLGRSGASSTVSVNDTMPITPSKGRHSFDDTALLIYPSPPASELRPALSPTLSPTCQEPVPEVDDRQIILSSPSGDYPSCMLPRLTPERIEDMMEKFCGRVTVRGVSGSMFEAWKSLYPELQEDNHINYEYDSCTSRLMIKFPTSAIHESVSIFFTHRVSAVLLSRLGEDEYDDTVQLSSGASYSRFTGNDYREDSLKIPDAYIHIDGFDFPTVVCETGWAEGIDDLKKDARLWLLGSRRETRVVIVVAFCESKADMIQPLLAADEPEEQTGLPDEDGLNEQPNPPEKTPHDGPTGAPDLIALDLIASPSNSSSDSDGDLFPEETALLASLDHTTKFLPLADALLRLHQHQQLSKPLIGQVSATVHLFRLGPGDAILETFTGTLLPTPPLPEPQFFTLTIGDLLSRNVAEAKGLDPDEEVRFAFEKLRRVVSKQIPKQEKRRAEERAVAEMGERGLWEEDKMTFAQSKRKRKRDVNDG